MLGSPSYPLTHNPPASGSLLLDCRYVPPCMVITDLFLHVCWTGCFVFDIRSCYIALTGLELAVYLGLSFNLCALLASAPSAYRHVTLAGMPFLVTCSASPASPQCLLSVSTHLSLYTSLGLVFFYFDGRNLAGFHMHVTEIELLFFGCILGSAFRFSSGSLSGKSNGHFSLGSCVLHTPVAPGGAC